MKVSVIIPVYNAEKFLPVCLESLAIQTMRDFEVIVVDDCSTDSSRDIAESYRERFDGRLKIFTLPANSGSGAVPRNVGLERACGEYVYFVDNDDLLIDNALETLYCAAAEYRADVVSMCRGFTCDEEPLPTDLNSAEWSGIDSDEPVIEIADFDGRLKKFHESQFEWVPWSKFLRRQFLIDNAIKFPAVKISDDIVWALKIIFSAERWLRIPTPLYVQRVVTDSFSRRRRTPERLIKFYASPLTIGMECLDEFMRRREYFKQNPFARLKLLSFFFNFHLDKMKDTLTALSAADAYEIFLREFEAAGNSQAALTAQLLVMNNLYRNELMK